MAQHLEHSKNSRRAPCLISIYIYFYILLYNMHLDIPVTLCGNHMRQGRKKTECLSNTYCCAVRSLWEHDSHRWCSNQCVLETREACLPTCLPPSLLSFLPSFCSFFHLKLLYGSFGVLSALNASDFRTVFEKKRKKKRKICDSLHRHSSYLPFTTLPAISVQISRSPPFQLIWIHFSNEGSWATMLKLWSITSSALPLSANVVIWFLSNRVSFDVISYLETWAYLQVFYLYTCLYNLYRYFLLGCLLIVLKRLGITHFCLYCK